MPCVVEAASRMSSTATRELVVVEAELHRAEVGLVHDAGPEGLQHERRAERARVRSVSFRVTPFGTDTPRSRSAAFTSGSGTTVVTAAAVRHRTVAPRSRPAPSASRPEAGRR